MRLSRSLALIAMVGYLAAGCRAYVLNAPELARVARGERFIESHGKLDPMPTVIDLADRETITLYDEQGNELRSTTVGNMKAAEAERASTGQIWRYSENRLGIMVGCLLVVGAGVAATFLLSGK
jgi:hypothetical protein